MQKIPASGIEEGPGKGGNPRRAHDCVGTGDCCANCFEDSGVKGAAVLPGDALFLLSWYLAKTGIF